MTNNSMDPPPISDYDQQKYHQKSTVSNKKRAEDPEAALLKHLKETMDPSLQAREISNERAHA